MSGYKTAASEGLRFVLARQRMESIHTQVHWLIKTCRGERRLKKKKKKLTYWQGHLMEGEERLCVDVSVSGYFFCVSISSYLTQIRKYRACLLYSSILNK